MSHIPPGNSDCWTIFSREFAKIINRFESTVAAQFYGHTHNEEYKVFYDAVNPSRAVNVAFVGGSLTTYSDMNPGYRVYTVDGPRIGSTYVGSILFSSFCLFALLIYEIPFYLDRFRLQYLHYEFDRSQFSGSSSKSRLV